MDNDHIHGEEKIGDPQYDVRAQDDPDPDDASIKDRVQSEIFRFPEIPKGDININVEGGIVVLRGQVADPDRIKTIVDVIRDVPGVRDVESYLHLPNEAAPNKESVLDVSP